MFRPADNTQQITLQTLHPATLLHHHNHATSYKRHPHLQLKKRRLGKQGNGLRSQSHWVAWLGFKHLLLHRSCPLRQKKGESRGRTGCLGRWNDSYPGALLPNDRSKGWECSWEWRLWIWLLLLQKLSSQKDHSFDPSHHTQHELKVYIPFSFGTKWYNQIQTVVCLKDPKELKMGILAFSQMRILRFY